MTKYPQSFINDVNDKTKKVYLVEPPQGYPGDCENCGGLGNLSAFYVRKGPFIHTPPCPRGEILKSVSDEHYGWLWFAGKTFDLECPKCDGLGKTEIKQKAPMSKEEYGQLPKIMIKKLAHEKRIPIARENPKPEPYRERELVDRTV